MATFGMVEYLNVEVNRPSTKQLLNCDFLEKLKQFSGPRSKMACLLKKM